MISTATPFSMPQYCHHCQADIWPTPTCPDCCKKRNAVTGTEDVPRTSALSLPHRQLGVSLWHLHIDLWCLHRQLSFQCLLGICSKCACAKHVHSVLVMHAHLPQMLWATLVSVPWKHLSGDLLWMVVLISSDWSGCSAPESGHLSHFCALPAFLNPPISEVSNTVLREVSGGSVPCCPWCTARTWCDSLCGSSCLQFCDLSVPPLAILWSLWLLSYAWESLSNVYLHVVSFCILTWQTPFILEKKRYLSTKP